MKPHIWCDNVNVHRPLEEHDAENCEMCQNLYKRYPMDRPEEEMVGKHFPNVKIIE